MPRKSRLSWKNGHTTIQTCSVNFTASNRTISPKRSDRCSSSSGRSTNSARTRTSNLKTRSASLTSMSSATAWVLMKTILKTVASRNFQGILSWGLSHRRRLRARLIGTVAEHLPRHLQTCLLHLELVLEHRREFFELFWSENLRGTFQDAVVHFFLLHEN